MFKWRKSYPNNKQHDSSPIWLRSLIFSRTSLNWLQLISWGAPVANPHCLVFKKCAPILWCAHYTFRSEYHALHSVNIPCIMSSCLIVQPKFWRLNYVSCCVAYCVSLPKSWANEPRIHRHCLLFDVLQMLCFSIFSQWSPILHTKCASLATLGSLCPSRYTSRTRRRWRSTTTWCCSNAQPTTNVRKEKLTFPEPHRRLQEDAV